jgi:hypothetical protein
MALGQAPAWGSSVDTDTVRHGVHVPQEQFEACGMFRFCVNDNQLLLSVVQTINTPCAKADLHLDKPCERIQVCFLNVPLITVRSRPYPC